MFTLNHTGGLSFILNSYKMEHIFKNNDELPMAFKIDVKNKRMNFVTHAMVMPGDTVTGQSVKGTIKEVVEERPSKGRWSNIGDGTVPTLYIVNLY